MRRFILNTLVFLLSFITIVIVPLVIVSNFDNIDKHSSDNSNIVSLQTESKFDNLDILFIGNSYCYSGIQPKILDSSGYKSYNLGIATAGVEFYELIINDYLANVKEYPKAIFILVSPMTFSSKSDNFSSYPIHRYLINSQSNIDIAFKYDRIKEVLSFYKKSISKGLFNIFSLVNHEEIKDTLSILNRGFVMSDEIVNKEIIQQTEYLYTPLANETFNFNKVEKLNKITNLLESKGIEIIYYELPTNKLNNYFSKGYLNDYNKVINRLKKKNKLLFVNDGLFSDSNFRNIDHMNTSGSIITTKEVIKFLNNIKFNEKIKQKNKLSAKTI